MENEDVQDNLKKSYILHTKLGMHLHSFTGFVRSKQILT